MPSPRRATRGYAPEAARAAACMRAAALPRDSNAALWRTVDGLLGEHPRIAGGSLTLAIDELLARLRAAHRARSCRLTARYQALRHAASSSASARRCGCREFKAKPLTSFVRNRLINEVYLPLIGDNLAKQMGTAGEGKRSDLMGLLMLISPPGYGKTTLMEYVAHRLGLVFMKINGPALGHEVRSLDPAQAPDATARQELEKLNLGAGDGQQRDAVRRRHPAHQPGVPAEVHLAVRRHPPHRRRVAAARPARYDLRGKKFRVVMAGNPYTESGEVFKIPDMLANRADIYNLGDVLGGMEDGVPAQLHREQPDLQPGAGAAGHARHGRPVPAGRQGDAARRSPPTRSSTPTAAPRSTRSWPCCSG